jgi:hypothetical protein
MTKTIDTKLEIKSWDENPYREFPDGRKFTRAAVELGGNDGIESATFDSLMFYRADGTSSYVTVMQVEATIDGRNGSFVLQGTGGFDGTSASGESTVIPGSGTGELTGLRGTMTSVSTHDDYPNMPITLTYAFE